MARVMVAAVAVLTLVLAACGSQQSTDRAQVALQKQADMYAIDQIEVIWHRAIAEKNVNMIVSVFSSNATWTVGPTTYAGTNQLRGFFAHIEPFMPANEWIPETPAYKIRVTVSGDSGTLYFECHFVDVTTGKLVTAAAISAIVARVNERWLITKAVSGTALVGL